MKATGLLAIAVAAFACRDLLSEPRVECQQPDACLQLGRDILRTKSIEDSTRPDPRDAERRRRHALIAFERACDGGVVEGCVEGAALFGFHDGGLPNGSRIHLEARGCELGDAPSCLARARSTTAPVPDSEKRVLARRACETTPARCVDAVSLVWEVDRAFAFELARLPCERRIPAACTQVANEISFDRPRRELLLAASCELEVAIDCYRLAEIESADPARTDAAILRYRRACTLGNSEACVWLGERRARQD